MTKPTKKKLKSPKGVLSRQPIPLRLMPAEVKKLKDFADRDARSVSAFARLAVLRGIEHFEREGTLVEA